MSDSDNAISKRLEEIAETRSLLEEEERGLRLSLRAREKRLGKTSNSPTKKRARKKHTRAGNRREAMLNAIVKFLQKNGSSRSRTLQEYLEAEGVLKVGAPGNQPTLSRFISREAQNPDSPIVKEGSGVVSLRK